MSPAGSLTVVGTGIRLVSQITFEARLAIEQADEVYHVAVDPLVPRWLEQHNTNVVSLNHLFGVGKPRLDSYREIVEIALGAVRRGAQVCLVFYGHPGVFVHPSHDVVRRARNEGYRASMLPAISAEDCLFADLGIDPATSGCQSFEAGDFLVHRRIFDPRSVLLLWQIGVIGEATLPSEVPNRHGLERLSARLGEHYPGHHPAIVYEAAQFPGRAACIQETTIKRLGEPTITTSSTLYVPPLPTEPVDLEVAAAAPDAP